MDEWETVLRALTDAEVAGTDDFGHFVNNTKYFSPSRFDAVAAGPVLLDLLPELTDPRVVATVGRYLKSVGRDGYDRVLEAFRKWGPLPGETGWVLGDTLARMADKSRASQFMELAADKRYGASRAFIVDALWRFKSVVDVAPLLMELVRDPDVSIYAVSSLQRTLGAAETGRVLRRLRNEALDDQVRVHVERQLKRIDRKLARATGE